MRPLIQTPPAGGRQYRKLDALPDVDTPLLAPQELARLLARRRCLRSSRSHRSSDRARLPVDSSYLECIKRLPHDSTAYPEGSSACRDPRPAVVLPCGHARWPRPRSKAMSSNPYERFTSSELILRDELAIDRTVLANERTLLSYIRTGLAFAVTGAGAIHFFASLIALLGGMVHGGLRFHRGRLRGMALPTCCWTHRRVPETAGWWTTFQVIGMEHSRRTRPEPGMSPCHRASCPRPPPRPAPGLLGLRRFPGWHDRCLISLRPRRGAGSPTGGGVVCIGCPWRRSEC